VYTYTTSKAPEEPFAPLARWDARRLSAYHYFGGDSVDTEASTAVWQKWLTDLFSLPYPFPALSDVGPGPLFCGYGGSDAELPDRVSTRFGEAGAKGTSRASRTASRCAHLEHGRATFRGVGSGVRSRPDGFDVTSQKDAEDALSCLENCGRETIAAAIRAGAEVSVTVKPTGREGRDRGDQL
jgi:hypothetical protein